FTRTRIPRRGYCTSTGPALGTDVARTAHRGATPPVYGGEPGDRGRRDTVAGTARDARENGEQGRTDRESVRAQDCRGADSRSRTGYRRSAPGPAGRVAIARVSRTGVQRQGDERLDRGR